VANTAVALETPMATATSDRPVYSHPHRWPVWWPPPEWTYTKSIVRPTINPTVNCHVPGRGILRRIWRMAATRRRRPHAR